LFISYVAITDSTLTLLFFFLLSVEIQEGMEEPENEANFTQVDVLLQ